MSDKYLCFFPTIPEYVPTEPAIREAVDLFRALYAASLPPDYVEAEIFENVEIVHPIENFSSIHCHLCNTQLDEDWWYGQLDQHYDKARGFTDLTITVPCCGAVCSLNDLNYTFPLGFARFQLSGLYAERSPTAIELNQFERILGCELRTTWKWI